MTDDTELDGIFYKYFPTYAIDDKYLTDAKAELIAWSERREAAARLDELQRLDTRRHYGKDYQDSLDELDEYKDNRIKQLTSDRTGGGEGEA